MVNRGQKAARLKNHPDDVLFTSRSERVLSTKCLLTADSQQGQNCDSNNLTVIQHMPRSAIVVLLCSHDTVSLDCMWEGYSTLHVWLLILLAPWFFFSFSFLLFGIWLAIFICGSLFMLSFLSILLLFGCRIWELSSDSALSYFHFQSFYFLVVGFRNYHRRCSFLFSFSIL